MLTRKDFRDAEDALSPTLIVLEELSRMFARERKTDATRLVQAANEALSTLILHMEAEDQTAPEDGEEAVVILHLQPGESIAAFVSAAIAAEVERRQGHGDA